MKNSDFLQNSDLSPLKISLEIQRVLGGKQKGLRLKRVVLRRVIKMDAL